MTVTLTFTGALTRAHQCGDEDEVNRLLDVQADVKAEVHARIDAVNDAAANFAHQLHALGVLTAAARENEMPIADGKLPLIRGVPIATAALQEWMDR
jgi:hypothetical protein